MLPARLCVLSGYSYPLNFTVLYLNFLVSASGVIIRAQHNQDGDRFVSFWMHDYLDVGNSDNICETLSYNNENQFHISQGYIKKDEVAYEPYTICHCLVHHHSKTFMKLSMLLFPDRSPSLEFFSS